VGKVRAETDCATFTAISSGSIFLTLGVLRGISFSHPFPGFGYSRRNPAKQTWHEQGEICRVLNSL
jgi:hypothetical protein